MYCLSLVLVRIMLCFSLICFDWLKLYYFLIADYVGHIKLVGEQALTAGLVLDEVEIASSRRLMVHLQTHE